MPGMRPQWTRKSRSFPVVIVVALLLTACTSGSEAGPFYLYYFARDCTGLEGLTDGNCFSITDEMIPVCPQPGDPACDRAVFSERDYIRPGTQRGPSSLLKLRPVIIVLQTPAQ